MTDDELLQRLEQSTPEEWTSDELDLLRERVRENAALAEAFADFVRLEQALTTSLSAGRITAEQVLARLDQRRRGPLGLGRWWRAAAALCLLAGGIGVWLMRRAPDEPEPQLVRRAQPGATEPAPPKPPRVAASPTAAPVATPTGVPMPTATATSAPPPVVVPPAVGGEEEPWTAQLAQAERAFDDWCLVDRRLSRTASQLTRWWNTLRGQQRPSNNGEPLGLHMAGLFQLRAPWPAGTVLSVWFQEAQNDRQRFCFWTGDEGVVLDFRGRPYENWAAYRGVKRPDEPLPRSLRYAASDNERHRRTGHGPIDFRWHDGRLYVSRGDVLFFSVALAAPPDTVCFEGAIIGRGFGLSRVGPLPRRWIDETAPDRIWSPTELTQPAAGAPLAVERWRTELPPGASFEPADDAGGTLVVSATTKPAWAAVPVSDGGMTEFLFDLEQLDAGTGIFLGDAEGRPRYSFGFFQEKPGDPLHVDRGRPTDAKPRYRYDPRTTAAPVVELPAQLRIVCGAGVTKLYLSADGRSWGQAIETWRGTDGPAATLGIYAGPGRERRTIKLTSIRSRPLFDADADFFKAGAADVGSLPPIDATAPGTWFVDVVERSPDPPPLAAYSVALLHRGVRYDTARTLMNWLALGAARTTSDPPTSTTVRASQLARLGWGAHPADGASIAFWQRRYAETFAVRPPPGPGDVANDLYALSVYSRWRRAWMESPLSTAGRAPLFPAELVREEILLLMRDGRWEELEKLCRVLHYFGGREDPYDRRAPPREPIMTLVDWAAAHAERRRPSDGGLPSAPQTTLKPEWRHPLIEQFGKEGYNVLAELETALAEKAYADACRIITSVTAAQAVGLLPNVGDADLLVSLPGAVALAMRDHPELRVVMQREYGDLAQLRLRQASSEGDVAAVQALTTQFYGTAAAAQAQMWLGDRSLAQGDAARAEGHYQAARGELPDGDLTPIDARLRLAAAMQGRSFGDPPASSVALGAVTLSPAEFERTVSALRARAPAVEVGPRSADLANDATTSPLPMPGRPVVKPFAKIEGDAGRNPEQPPRREVDYVGAQTSLTFDAARMYYSNRFQTAAYDLKDGKLAWRTGLGGEAGRTYQWPLVPMPPIVVEGRLFVRRLTAAGPELACLRTSDGGVEWRSPRGEIVAADPLVAADRVLAVTLSLPQTDVVEAALTMYDRRTGKVLVRRPLMQLRDYWKRELPCHLISAGEMIVASLGGCVVGVSGEGEPRWLRRLTWIPASVDPTIGAAYPMPPQFVEGALVVAQPGAAFAKKIDVRTGAVRERTPIFRTTPEAEGLVVPTTRRLTHGLESFQIEESSTERRWYRAWGAWAGETQGFATAAWPTPWQRTRPAIGPLASHEGRYFAVVGTDLKSAAREIVEFTIATPLKTESPEVFQVDYTLDREQLPPLPAGLESLSRSRSPWLLVQSRYDERQWFENPLFLNDDCRLTSAAPNLPVLWTRRVSLSKLNPRRLELRVAAAGGEPWRLVVRADGKPLVERTIEPVATGSPWVDVVVDLAPPAGRDVRLVAAAEVIGKPTKPVLAAWQRMEIVEP